MKTLLTFKIDLGTGHISTQCYDDAEGKELRIVVAVGDDELATELGLNEVVAQFWTTELRAKAAAEQQERDDADAARDAATAVAAEAAQKQYQADVAAEVSKQLAAQG